MYQDLRWKILHFLADPWKSSFVRGYIKHSKHSVSSRPFERCAWSWLCVVSSCFMGLFWKFLSGIFSIDDRDGSDNVTRTVTSNFALTPSRSIWQMLTNFLELNSKGLYLRSEKEKSVKIRLPSQCYSSIQLNRDSIFRTTCKWLISSTKNTATRFISYYLLGVWYVMKHCVSCLPLNARNIER